jgi:hypothetical protein
VSRWRNFSKLQSTVWFLSGAVQPVMCHQEVACGDDITHLAAAGLLWSLLRQSGLGSQGQGGERGGGQELASGGFSWLIQVFTRKV